MFPNVRCLHLKSIVTVVMLKDYDLFIFEIDDRPFINRLLDRFTLLLKNRVGTQFDDVPDIVDKILLVHPAPLQTIPFRMGRLGRPCGGVKSEKTDCKVAGFEDAAWWQEILNASTAGRPLGSYPCVQSQKLCVNPLSLSATADLDS